LQILEIAKTYRNLKRLKDIVLVLTGHGFGQLVEQMRLGRFIPFLRRFTKNKNAEAAPTGTPERLARAMEELGPTFVKLGQLLATRPDMIPEPYVRAFATLQDRVAPFPADEARACVEKELGRPLDEVFSSFDDQPLASGSLAQVHGAVLKSENKTVAVKVLRPGAEKAILSDLGLLAALAELVEKYVPELAVLKPTMIVEEFGRSLRRELRFTTEASTLVKFRKLFKDGSLIIPEVYWELSGPGLLVMEKIEGLPLTDQEALSAAGVDKPALARSLCDSFLRQFFEFGTFHADPHPGNIMVLPGSRPALIDFGNVGYISQELKSQLATSLLALVRGDTELIISIYTDIGIFSDGADLSSMRLDLLELLDRYYGVPARSIDLGEAFYDILGLARRHEVCLPRDFVMLGRSFVLMSSVVRRLDPDIDIAEAVRPFAKKLLLQKLSPAHILKRAGTSIYYLTSLITSLPRDLRQLMKKAQSGRLTMTLRHQGLERLIEELDRSSSRLSFALIIGSLVVGSSLVMHAKLQPLVFGDQSLLGLLGFSVAGIMGLGLTWLIYRSGKL
jgi:ubiquinone biosynthesis protein